MTIFFWTKGPKKKLYPTANFYCKITLKIFTKFTWDFLRKSVTKVPLKNYALGSQLYKHIFTKIWKQIEMPGYNVWVEFLSPNFFWNFGKDLFAKLSNKSSPQKVYPWCLNFTNRSLPKFEKKLRCLGYNFWVELLWGIKTQEF